LSACEGEVCRVGGWPCRRTALFHCCLCRLALFLASRSPLRTGGRRRRRRALRPGSTLVTGPRGVRTSRPRLALAGRAGLERWGEVWVHLSGPVSSTLCLGSRLLRGGGPWVRRRHQTRRPRCRAALLDWRRSSITRCCSHSSTSWRTLWPWVRHWCRKDRTVVRRRRAKVAHRSLRQYPDWNPPPCLVPLQVDRSCNSGAVRHRGLSLPRSTVLVAARR
jgi:hypothetical protein